MTIALGIDLGTASCCVYAAVHGEPVAILNHEGSRTTPSVIAYTPEGQLLAGAPARRQAALNPARTLAGAKRLAGRKLVSPALAHLRGHGPVPLVASNNGDVRFRVDDAIISPEEALARLLEHVATLAHEQLGAPVGDVVLAVPAMFDMHQRRALKAAAELAGLRVLRLLQEPTAAALAHGEDKQLEQCVAVIDFGAGSFDVSVVWIADGLVEVLGTAGHDALGGANLDDTLVAHLRDAFRTEHGVDVGDDATAAQRLCDAAATLRHDLSTTTMARVDVPFLTTIDGAPAHLVIESVDRGWLERQLAAHLDGLERPCHDALLAARLRPDDIDRIVVLGGTSRMPAVVDRIEHLFGKRPTREVNANEAVARGAALLASVLVADATTPLVIDTQPLPLELAPGRGPARTLVPAGHRIPCRVEHAISLAEASLPSLDLYQVRGDARTPVGKVPLATRSALQLRAAVDANGLLELSAEETATRRGVSLRVELASGLSPEERSSLAHGWTPVAVDHDSEIHSSPTLSSPGSDPPDGTSSRPPAPSGPPTPAHPAPTTPERSPSAHGRSAARPVRRAPARRASERPTALDPSARATHDADDQNDDSDGLSTQGEPQLPVGTVIDNRYIIDGLIGVGGMALVYRAHHRVIDKTVAIKVLRHSMAQRSDVASRFVREAQAASRIGNPHVVDILDFGELPDGTSYFAMEHLEGKTLTELLAARRPLATSQVVDIAVQLAEGLAAAHAQGVVHRDLKPDNIKLIERQGKTSFCKIVDFGIAKLAAKASAKLTMAGAVLGTPHYMSPEQTRGDPIDGRSDIYSLGVILYEMLAGDVPFDAPDAVSVLRKHMLEAPAPIRGHRGAADCPPELEAIVLRCLRKLPAERFASMGELSAALETLRR